MTHTKETERADFEAWATTVGLNLTLDGHGIYTRIETQAAWMAWTQQAARRVQVVAVPQEPTSKQVVLGAGALLGQPEHTADNRHPEWHSAVEKVRKVYLAMLAAAPQPSSPHGTDTIFAE